MCKILMEIKFWFSCTGNPNNGEMCQEKCSSPQNNVVLPDESVDNQVNVERQEEEDHTSNKKKQTRNRKRKKGLHNLVRAQMEFYFSDANLSKDRFMQNATKDGPGTAFWLDFRVVICSKKLCYYRSTFGCFHDFQPHQKHHWRHSGSP